MLKKLFVGFAAGSLLLLQSCSVNSETTYYNDSASSLQSHISVDRQMFSMMNMMQQGSGDRNSDFGGLTTSWKSLYEMQKDGTVTLNEKKVAPLKKMFVRLNKNNGEIEGISFKYDKLLPAEIASIFASRRELSKIPLSDLGRWDGKKLEIDTDKFNATGSFGDTDWDKITWRSPDQPKTKQDSIINYGKQMIGGMMGMLKMVNMNFSSTLKFHNPIKAIEGKHDFVEQIDRNTVRINVRTADLWDKNKLKNHDKKVIIITE